MLSNIITI